MVCVQRMADGDRSQCRRASGALDQNPRRRVAHSRGSPSDPWAVKLSSCQAVTPNAILLFPAFDHASVTLAALVLWLTVTAATVTAPRLLVARLPAIGRGYRCGQLLPRSRVLWRSARRFLEDANDALTGVCRVGLINGWLRPHCTSNPPRSTTYPNTYLGSFKGGPRIVQELQTA